MHSQMGYDGIGWRASNGSVVVVDLKPLVADETSQAFVDRAGWRDRSAATSCTSEFSDADPAIRCTPAGGSEVEVFFDPTTHLVRRVILHTDDGPRTTTYDDWRTVGELKVPFREVQTDSTGGVTTFELTAVRMLKKLPTGAIARPQRSPHGVLTSDAEARVSFTYAGKSHILAPMTINGVKANAIFDTGAANYFAPEAARRFGLETTGGFNLSGVGESSTTGGFAKADTIAIGGAELKDEVVIVAPTPWPQSAGAAAGFAGFEFLSEFRTTIDYGARTITFSPFSRNQQVTGTRIPFYSDGHSIYVEAKIDDESGLLRLDTGDGGTVTIFPKFARLHHLDRAAGDSVALGGGVGGTLSTRRLTLPRFKVAGTEFQDVQAALSQNKAGAFTSESLAGNLGGGILRCFRLTFDYMERTVAFERILAAGDCAVASSAR